MDKLTALRNIQKKIEKLVEEGTWGPAELHYHNGWVEGLLETMGEKPVDTAP